MKKILSVLFVVALVFGFAGCGDGGGATAEQAVKNAFDAIKAADVEKASEYIDYDKLLNAGEQEKPDTEEDVQSKEMMGLILENIDYRILESSQEEDTAIVKAEITNKDMGSVMAGFISQAFALAFSGMNEEQLNEQYMEVFTKLVKEEAQTVTSEVDIKLSKSDGKWQIDVSDELLDALMGGMISYANSISDAFGGETDSER